VSEFQINVPDPLTARLSANGYVTPGAYWCAHCGQRAYGTFGTVGWCDEHGEVDRCGGVPAGTFHCSDDTPVPEGSTRWGEPPSRIASDEPTERGEQP
jgi:hypothetical protein